MDNAELIDIIKKQIELLNNKLNTLEQEKDEDLLTILDNELNVIKQNQSLVSNNIGSWCEY